MKPLLNVLHSPAAPSPGRMAPLARLPVFLALEDKRAILAGGNAAAAWKAELLSAAGARVDVYVEETSEEMRTIAADPPGGPITVHERAWTADDIAGAAIAVGAFEQEADARLFAEAARAAGVPVNVIDKPAFCDFAFGAIVNRSPLVIGISTGGAAPVFAQAIRGKIETFLPTGFAIWAAAAQAWRSAVSASGLSSAGRRKFWQLFATHAVIKATSEPGQADFDQLMAEVQGQGGEVENGSVTLVDAGPGDPESLTLRAVRALQSADIILFDERVSREVLDFARREARKLLVGSAGKEAHNVSLMAGLARCGKRVVRLAGGSIDSAGSVRELAGSELANLSSAAAPDASAARNGAAA